MNLSKFHDISRFPRCTFIFSGWVGTLLMWYEVQHTYTMINYKSCEHSKDFWYCRALVDVRGYPWYMPPTAKNDLNFTVFQKIKQKYHDKPCYSLYVMHTKLHKSSFNWVQTNPSCGFKVLNTTLMQAPEVESPIAVKWFVNMCFSKPITLKWRKSDWQGMHTPNCCWGLGPT